jgi:signal transduction histidine kinase
MRLAPLTLLLFAPVTFALDGTRSISQYGHTRWTLQEGALPGAPTDMAQTTDDYLWVGTRGGLVRFDGGCFMPFAPPRAEGLLTSSVLSLRAARGGSLWIGTRSGLEHWQNGHLIHYPDTPGAIMSILEDPAGKIWFTRMRSALSLVVPRKNNFRYRLVGHDTDWIDAGARRQAFYTDLPPCAYRFQVIASNNDGVWNESGASLDFSIIPTFYQTPWFVALCITAVVGTLWLLYLMRVKQIEMRIRMRLEARVIERERIARDLHDTLLQSMQGLILRFQAVLAHIPEGGERPLQMMEQALERADQVLAEGRDHVYDLRKSTYASNDLPQALQALAEDLAQTADNTRFRVTVEGTVRKVHPVVREETYRIGAEALTNAVRHAMATQVDTEIAYSRKSLTLRIVDNGRGFDAAVLDEGAPRGHFGLTGMRERARRIRARFEVSTRPGSGSAVEVRVPASIAYRVERRRA